MKEPPDAAGGKEQPPQSGNNGSTPSQDDISGIGTNGTNIGGDSGSSGGSHSGGPAPGGPAPRSFFETLSWHGKLDPINRDHQGLLCAVDELYRLSQINCGRQKAYKSFPVATGMILRTVYEQSLRLRLNQVGLWGAYCRTRPKQLPTLKSMEDFINQGENKTVVFPDQGMVITYDRVIAATHRDFLRLIGRMCG